MCVIEGRETRDYVWLFWSHAMREGRPEQGSGGYSDNRPVPYATLRGGPWPGDNGTCNGLNRLGLDPKWLRHRGAAVCRQIVGHHTTPLVIRRRRDRDVLCGLTARPVPSFRGTSRRSDTGWVSSPSKPGPETLGNGTYATAGWVAG